MLVEITSYRIENGSVFLTAVDVSEEHLQKIKRGRDDGEEKEIEFLFSAEQKNSLSYLKNWLKRQKATAGTGTWGEALRSVIGTVTDINMKYRSWL